MPSGTTACRMGVAWFCALVAGAVACAAGATAAPQPPSRITAQTPLRPDALSAADFDAIVAEARTVPRGVPPDGRIVLPDTWRTLTREKLAAMLVMPRLGKIPYEIRQILIDQAATWDLFDFKRPSDAATLWGRVWSEQTRGRPAHFFFEYIPDATWSPTSLAMASIFHCFPREAWTAQQPVVASAMGARTWHWADAADFQGCIHSVGTGFVDWTPRLLAEVSQILETKFSDELREDGCTRKGPDSCLVIFQALYSLDPRNRELPALLQKMQPAFGGREVPRWQAAANDQTPITMADAIHTQMLRRMAFITVELPVLLDRPEAWPAGETGRMLTRALRISLDLDRLQRLDRQRYYYKPERRVIDPWRWLKGPQPQLAPELRNLGRAFARTEGCALSTLATQLTPAFRNAYVVENIRLGNGGCGRENQLPLAGLVTAQAPRRKQLMALFQPIAAQLAGSGSLHDIAMDQVAGACRGGHPSGRDPFGLCTAVRARDAARRSAALAAAPKPDPLACPDDTLAGVEQALGVQPQGGGYAACRRNPTDTRQAFVALAYQEDGGNPDTGDGDYDLDLAFVDIDSGKILARRHDARGIPSDAVYLDRIWLDTARYDLAPGRRAFGVRTHNDASCYQCVYGYSTLYLYLRDGKRLRKIFTTTVAETHANDGVDYSTRTILCIGKHRHHGLADIVTSEGTSCSAADPDARTWRYDGRHYVRTEPPH